MIRHGKYFTLTAIFPLLVLLKEWMLSTGQAIGKVGESDDGTGGQIDFMLMIETKNVNPEPWLRRR